MARLADRYPENAPGNFFVDRSCIDCATCRQIAPSVFTAGGGFSYVGRQPGDDGERLEAMKALVACPTASIGTVSPGDARRAIAAFPEVVDGNVHFCGFTSKSSFGAWSYLVVHERFRAEFSCDRVLHRRDATGSLAAIERQPEGDEAVSLDEDLLLIPTPGHTRGHVVYLYRKRYLFTGDHLAFSEKRGHLYAFRDACWYSWSEQIRSMERLLEYEFEWVLPGHGARYRAASPGEMRRQVETCIAWMEGSARRGSTLDGAPVPEGTSGKPDTTGGPGP